MSTIIRTLTLPALLQDCTQQLGFVCRQFIPGVLALVDHGPLQLQLWACGAHPGRWEAACSRDLYSGPEQHSVVVNHIHTLYASLYRTLLQQTEHPDGYLQRLSPSGPKLQAWGAWEFSLLLHGGHHLHCVDWNAWVPDAARAQAALKRAEPDQT